MIECKTYRYLPHTSDDDDKSYRAARRWRSAAPRSDRTVRHVPHRAGHRRRDAIQAVHDEVKSDIEAAITAAWEAPDPTRRPRSATSSPRATHDAEERRHRDPRRPARRDGRRRAHRAAGRGRRRPRRGVQGLRGGWTSSGRNAWSTRRWPSPAIVGVAIGMALHGLLPIAEIEFADFIHPAFDQILSEASRMRYRTNGDWGCPMVIRAPCGGGIHGALYHSQSIEAFYAHIPGVKVVDAVDPGRCCRTAAHGDRRPRPGLVPRAQEVLPRDQG